MLKLSCGKPSITKVLTAPVNDLEPQERVPVLAYLDLGISPEWPYIKAAEAVKNLNKTNSVEKEKIRNAKK